MLSDIEIAPGTTVIVTSDNCTGQYKSAQNFFDLQRLANHYECTLIRIYGIAGHGKNEVDAVGGVAKIAICNAIAQGQSFLNADDCVNFLSSKFGKRDAPSYSLHLIETESIEKE